MGLLKSLIYLAVVSVASFILGRVIPVQWFQYEKFPYCPFEFEKDGRIYRKIGVHKWKEQFPDMSVIFPKWMPSKKMPKAIDVEQATLMIQETCIAEMIHGLLGIVGFGCIFIWQGIGGISMGALYLLGNLPYMIIQRYNRPKLVKILRGLEKKAAEDIRNKQENIYGERSDIKLQYGTGTQFLCPGSKRVLR